LDTALREINIQYHTDGDKPIAVLEEDVQLLAPVPNPQSFRDFYAFEQHVRAARKLRGVDMHPDWFKIAIFYFSNPAALYGHGEDIPYPRGTNELDYELEFAIIIAKGGSDINQDEADKYIAGYTICNDWSARDLQREEMAMSLGPAKGKDFIRQSILSDLSEGKNGSRVFTRFPPEPNGYLHIGHAQSICLNYGIASEFQGRCYLRFDDTNPTKESENYVDAIKQDVLWLGFNWQEHLTHASDTIVRCN